MQRKKSCQATTMDDNSRIKIKTFACSINDTGFFFLPFVGRVWTIVLYGVITNLGRIFFFGGWNICGPFSSHFLQKCLVCFVISHFMAVL